MFYLQCAMTFWLTMGNDVKNVNNFYVTCDKLNCPVVKIMEGMIFITTTDGEKLIVPKDSCTISYTVSK